MKKSSISRRNFLRRTATVGVTGVVASSIMTSCVSGNKDSSTGNRLAATVQMQFMRPGQLDKAMRLFPVVYVPIGLIEWHGKHLPLGTDALKSHAILVKCAEEFGGVVYPPIYFPYARYVKGSESLHPEENQWKIDMFTALFDRIKKMGARVIIGVSGHNINQQIALINMALKPVIADGTITGIGLWEMSLSKGKESASDHAAKWETSDMMFFYPELVDMSTLGTGPLVFDRKPPEGIGGLDPRVHASVEVGKRNVELAAAALGRKAKELLETLPPDQRNFNLPAIDASHWHAI